MSHANACLTPAGRLRPGPARRRRQGWTLRRAAERWQLLRHDREAVGRPLPVIRAGPASSTGPRRPACSPRRTPTRRGARVVGLRVLTPLGSGPDRLPARAGGPRRCTDPAPLRLPTPGVDRPATGVRIKWSRKKANTDVHDAPGDLVHVDIKKLGRIPDGGGWRVLGRQAGRQRNSGQRGTGYCVHPQRRRRPAPASPTARSSPTSARRPPPRSGSAPTPTSPRPAITVKRVLTDNGSCYRSARLRRRARRADHTQANPALPTTDQRQGRALQPHPARRMGLRPALQLASPNAPRSFPSGSTPTITTAVTPRSAASHQPTSCPTCVDRTASPARPRPPPTRPSTRTAPKLVPFTRDRAGSAGRESRPPSALLRPSG